MVGPIADQVKDQASAVAQQQMTSAAEGLDSAAGAVNAVGDRLRENHLGELSQYTDLAAEQIEKLAVGCARRRPKRSLTTSRTSPRSSQRSSSPARSPLA